MSLHLEPSLLLYLYNLILINYICKDLISSICILGAHYLTHYTSCPPIPRRQYEWKQGISPLFYAISSLLQGPSGQLSP